MKTSNKLLLGLLVLVVIGIIIVNIFLKRQFDRRRNSDFRFEQTMPSDTASEKEDSIAMDKAIKNE